MCQMFAKFDNVYQMLGTFYQMFPKVLAAFDKVEKLHRFDYQIYQKITNVGRKSRLSMRLRLVNEMHIAVLS